MSVPFEKGTDAVYRCVAWREHQAWVDHGFANRYSSAYVKPAVTLRQIHSAYVVKADGLVDKSCEGDALVSDERAKRIGVRTADCVPLLFLDTEHNAVAAVHAGWRGTAASIVGATLETMERAYKTSPQHVEVAIGPAIRQCCYEVGDEVAAAFRSVFPEGIPPSRRSGRIMLDLIEANRRLLVQAGVPAENIFDSGLCTYCDKQFFSFRREPDNPGRMISFIARQ